MFGFIQNIFFQGEEKVKKFELMMIFLVFVAATIIGQLFLGRLARGAHTNTYESQLW